VKQTDSLNIHTDKAALTEDVNRIISESEKKKLFYQLHNIVLPTSQLHIFERL